MREKTDQLVKNGTRVELNDGVAPAAQGQRGVVTSHRWSAIGQEVLNVIQMDDPDWGVKYSSGYSPGLDTLAVGTHCCELIDGATEQESLFDGLVLRERLREEDRQAHA